MKENRRFAYFLMFVGLWMILDGVVSYILYLGQTPMEQFVRVFRSFLGLLMLLMVRSSELYG